MNKYRNALDQGKGFTLIELMITLVIIGIITAFAYPSYKSQIYKSRRADGQALLLDAMAKQQRHHSELHRFTLIASTSTNAAGETEGLGYTLNTDNEALSRDAWYTLGMAACPEPNNNLAFCVALTATPRNDQVNDAQCARLTYDSQGRKGRTGSAATNNCW